ncbi:flagella synthesis protein FlgN [Ferribacterium limneticum]|uniref:flagella synthesis protein FlgN n=1 Tax=Ferribacterium limneticum TaxID=76259 RepID=UPI001CF94C2C|nr:flagellar protein FlgN [Ferribacterium limneticum]UCV19740.1 flagellar protein FlgN [Ferribacterium limneticum]
MTIVAKLLKREAELVVRFRNTLLREQEILRTGKSDDLAEINTEKLSLVDSLNLAGAERARALSSSDEATIDMQAWFSAHPSEIEALELWKGLLGTAREARAINELNGSLINVLHQKTSDALSILTQGKADQSLYSSNGQASPSTGSRIIDSA